MLWRLAPLNLPPRLVTEGITIKVHSVTAKILGLQTYGSVTRYVLSRTRRKRKLQSYRLYRILSFSRIIEDVMSSQVFHLKRTEHNQIKVLSVARNVTEIFNNG